jgi:hypothetical protein
MTDRAHSSTSASRLVVLFAAILIGLFALDRLGAVVLRAAYGRSSASPDLLLPVVRPDTVVVGTSTAKYSFRPDAWKGKLLNLAQDGQTVIFSIVQAAVLPPVGSLRRLIVVVDAGDLEEGLRNPNVARVWRIAPALAEHPQIEALLKPERSPWAPLAWSHLYRYRGSVEDIVKRLIRPETAAYEALKPGPVSKPHRVVNDTKKKPRTESEARGHDLDPSLDRFIALLGSTARRLGVHLILVAPLAYERPLTVSKKRVLSELVQRLKGAPVCNLFDVDTPELRRIRDKPGYFHDEVHLDGPGATAYTREMMRVIAERCQG